MDAKEEQKQSVFSSIKRIFGEHYSVTGKNMVK